MDLFLLRFGKTKIASYPAGIVFGGIVSGGG
jgi:hypothetical protein